MAEPLKNVYHRAFIEQFSRVISNVYPAFNKVGFMKAIFDEAWEQRELKQRVRHITESLHQTLDMEYAKAIQILSSIVDQCSGFPYIFFPDYIEAYGLEDLNTSIPALARFTSSSTSEYAIRPFIQQHPDLMMSQMLEWAKDANHHVRRLASEGCRPRLPWGMALKLFQFDPAPILPILEQLKQDESEYVRKSVANNLNDISKDHPGLVIEIAKQWYGEHPYTDAIVKHGLRSLLKKGVPEALELFGFVDADQFVVEQFKLSQQMIQIGDEVEFSFVLRSDALQSEKKLRIEYAVDFMKANGKHTSKIFQISESMFTGVERAIVRKHSFRDLSTRKHYPGEHRITLIVNGKSKAEATFELV